MTTPFRINCSLLYAIDTTASTQYQKIKNLKATASVHNFLIANSITNVDNFYNKIVEMNKGFYVLKGEVQTSEKGIAKLEQRLVLGARVAVIKSQLIRHCLKTRLLMEFLRL